MQVVAMRHEFEAFSKQLGEVVWTISGDREATTFLRPVWRKGGNDRMAADVHRAREVFQIGRPLRRIDEEVEHCPVVPQVVMAIRGPSGDVCRNPFHCFTGLSQPVSGYIQGDLR